MASDAVYEQCLPILQDPALEEEDKTDRLEDFIRKETSLTGKSLENAVLDTLWRYRNGGSASSSPPIARHTVVRRNSPAPWQSSRSGTPTVPSPRSSAASPVPPPGLANRPSLFRVRSSQRSPFTSPKPSPRLAFATTALSHTVSDAPPGPDTFGEYTTNDPGDWQDDGSNASSYFGEFGAATPEFVPAQMMDMTPYDILRSVLRDQKTDDEIETILESNGYDLSAAIASLTEGEASQLPITSTEQDKTYLVGKSMNAGSRPVTPAGQQKSNVVCRYWLQTGQCLRADCRFSHDLSGHLCKYWLAGNCLAGDSCIFSHDPSALMANMSLDGTSQYAVTPPIEPNFQDYNSFPTLAGASPATSMSSLYSQGNDGSGPASTFSPRPGLAPEFVPSRPQSRPTSRQQSNLTRGLNQPGLDDSDAFPTLGAAAATKGPKKHHGKRGHGHSHRGGGSEKENASSSLADVVKTAPSPLSSPRKGAALTASARSKGATSKENSAAAQAIPAPVQIPWLATGDAANKAYLAARAQAIKHGGARNKFLQSAAQAWNRQDVRAAKALSLRGQAENDSMREAHREAARHLYDERNKTASRAAGGEIYVDLHGLHPGEAVEYLSDAMGAERRRLAVTRDDGDAKAGIVYAIVGTGHHSKGGRDKVGKAIRAWLNDRAFAFREFSVPNDRGGNGGILGVDIRSGDLNEVDPSDKKALGASPLAGAAMEHGKIRILKAGDPEASTA